MAVAANLFCPGCPSGLYLRGIARAVLLPGLYLLLLASAIAATGELGFSRSVTPGLISHYVSLFGSRAGARITDWKGFVRGVAGRIDITRDSSGEVELARVVRVANGSEPPRKGSGEVELLGIVNRYFNGMPSDSDSNLWGVEDYWATPSEFEGIGAGDCEDYVIAKYFALKELGVPITRLRMVYVRTWKSSSGHLVLAYYPSPQAEPLILDNLTGSIELASDRPDLTPVFAFNDDDVMPTGPGPMGVRINGSSVRQWQIVTEKLIRELTY